MKTHESKPSLKKAGILFATLLIGCFGVGMLLQSLDTKPAKKVARNKPPRAVTKVATARTETVGAPDSRVVVAMADGVEKPGEEGAPAAPPPAPESAESEAAVATTSGPPVSWAEAEDAYLAGDWSAAAELFARFTSENPGHPWGRYMSGLAHRKTGELDVAERELVAALGIRPDHGKSLVNLGRVLLDAERPKDALAFLEQAVATNPDDVAAHRVRARALHTLGRRTEALEEYARALAIDENDVWSLNNTGLLLIEEGRFEEAQVPLAQACALDEGIATFRNNLGVALERSGDLAAAGKAFAEALELDPEYEKARISLARVESRAPEAIPAGSTLTVSAEPVGISSEEDPIVEVASDSRPRP